MRIEKILVYLLLACALSKSFDGFAVYFLGDFAVRMSHVVFLFSYFISFFHFCNNNAISKNKFILILWPLLILVLEVVHAILGKYSLSISWLKSTLQYVLYSSLFTLLTLTKFKRCTIIELAQAVYTFAILFCIITIIQFCLLQAGFMFILPKEHMLTSWDVINTQRYMGIVPAIFLTTEPSYHAISLVFLYYLCIILRIKKIGVFIKKKTYYVDILLLVSVFMTLSVTGILSIMFLLFAGIVHISNPRKFMVYTCGLMFILVCMYIIVLNVPAIEGRMSRILHGEDNSSQRRVFAAVKLLVTDKGDTVTNWFGTGLGMEEKIFDIFADTYEMFNTLNISVYSEEIKIHNTFTVLKIYHGWTGLFFYFVFLYKIIRPANNFFILYFVSIIYLGLLHFSTGAYLSPFFWSILTILCFLLRVPGQTRKNMAIKDNNNEIL